MSEFTEDIGDAVELIKVAGVWVKASERKPGNNNLVHIRWFSIIGTKSMLTGFFEKSLAQWFRQDGSHLLMDTNIEWLDESVTYDSLRVQLAKSRRERDEALKRAEYWEKRCAGAEYFADPDPLYLSSADRKLFDKWQDLKNNKP